MYDKLCFKKLGIILVKFYAVKESTESYVDAVNIHNQLPHFPTTFEYIILTICS